jgi:hypothetical protein
MANLILVRIVCDDMGYSEAEEGDDEWTLSWSDTTLHMDRILKMKDFQVLNLISNFNINRERIILLEWLKLQGRTVLEETCGDCTKSSLKTFLSFQKPMFFRQTMVN